jgi:glycine oxidase
VPHYSGEGASGYLARFMAAARDVYPSYLRWVDERSGVRVSLQTAGAVEVARSPAECAALQGAAPPDAVRLTSRDVANLEPSLAPVAGGVLYPRDGAVDNVRLTEALTIIVERDARVRVVPDVATRVDVDAARPRVVTASGVALTASRIVLAAGAWSAAVAGVPRPVPVRPLRGQMCAVQAAPLRHIVLSGEVYMVTRGGNRTLIGSTMEEVGFETGTTTEAIRSLRRGAAVACPILESASLLDAWSGLRPATPDLLPILGPDPDCPGLIYACGHSRNGILLAPITGALIASIAAGESPSWEVGPFSIARFREAAVRS